MRASTHTLDLNRTVDWPLVVVSKVRQQAPAVVAGIEAESDRERATEEIAGSCQASIQPDFGDATEFVLFAVTVAVIGWLHLELLALVW